jgi:hypothetical protein
VTDVIEPLRSVFRGSYWTRWTEARWGNPYLFKGSCHGVIGQSTVRGRGRLIGQSDSDPYLGPLPSIWESYCIRDWGNREGEE